MEKQAEQQFSSKYKEQLLHSAHNYFNQWRANDQRLVDDMDRALKLLPEWVQFMINKGLSNKTVNLYVTALISDFGDRIDPAYIAPVRKWMKKHMVSEKRELPPVTLDQTQVDTIITGYGKYVVKLSSRQFNTLVYWLFSCYTGLRAADVFALNSQNSSMQQGKDGSWALIVGLNQKSGIQMKIPVNSFCRMVYRNFPLEQAASAHRDASTNIKKALKVLSDSHPFLRDLVSVEEKRGKKVIIRQVPFYQAATFHTARHTYTKMLLEADVDVYTASQLLGHKKIQTTIDHYASLGLDKRNSIVASKLGFL